MRKETRERAGEKGIDMNIWGLLETEEVPSCSPDLHCAKERTMGMTLLLSKSGAGFTCPIMTLLPHFPRISHCV